MKIFYILACTFLTATALAESTQCPQLSGYWYCTGENKSERPSPWDRPEIFNHMPGVLFITQTEENGKACYTFERPQSQYDPKLWKICDQTSTDQYKDTGLYKETYSVRQNCSNEILKVLNYTSITYKSGGNDWREKGESWSLNPPAELKYSKYDATKSANYGHRRYETTCTLK